MNQKTLGDLGEESGDAEDEELEEVPTSEFFCRPTFPKRWLSGEAQVATTNPDIFPQFPWIRGFSGVGFGRFEVKSPEEHLEGWLVTVGPFGWFTWIPLFPKQPKGESSSHGMTLA